MTTSPVVTRELSIVYGAVTMGGSSVYHIDKSPGMLVWRVSGTEATVSWHVVVHGASSASDLDTACGTLEDEFQKRFLRFRVIHDSVDVIDWNPSGSVNTGFLAQPQIEVVDHPATTGRSRMYRCSVTVQLPATDNTGRRWASIELGYDDSGCKTVTITGQYTAQGSNGARANYEAKIGTFASAALAALGGTYNSQPTMESATADDQDKLCDFRRVYRAINYAETASGNIDAILAHEVAFSLAWEAPGDSPGGPYGEATRLQAVTGVYNASVDVRVTTDLDSLWSGTLRSYVMAQASVAYPGASALVREDVTFDRQNNKIRATVLLMVASVGGLLEYRVTQEYRNLPGKIVVPVWNKDRYAKRVYQGPSDTLRTTTAVWRAQTERGALGVVQGTSYAAGSVGRNGDGQNAGPESGWILVEEAQQSSPVRLGILRHGRTMVVWESSVRIVETWAGAVRSGATTSAGGSGAPSAGGGSGRGAPLTGGLRAGPGSGGVGDNGLGLRPPPGGFR
jgi:hypothetical protein